MSRGKRNTLSDDLEFWSRDMDELVSRIPEEDFLRLETALAEVKEAGKEQTRRTFAVYFARKERKP